MVPREAAPDHARLLPLMWAPRDKVSRTGLGIGTITSAGIELADAEGLEAVTMRAVAQRLNVGAMSLYTHVPGKPELVALMSDVVLGEVYEDRRKPVEAGEWPDRLRHVARSNWDMLLAHPWRLDIRPGHDTMGPGLVGKYELELQAVDGIGLTDVDMDLAISLVTTHASSAAAWYLGVRRTAGDRSMSADEWWEQTSEEWHERVGPALAMAMGPATYPLASRVGEAASLAYEGADPEALFRFGLERIIAGLAELVEHGGDEDA